MGVKIALFSEKVSHSKNGSGTGKHSVSRWSFRVDSSISDILNGSRVGVSEDTSTKFVESLNSVNLFLRDALDILENDPFDSFIARRVSPRSIVSPEILEVERLEEIAEVNFIKDVVNIVSGLSLEDRGKEWARRTSSSWLRGRLLFLLFFNSMVVS